jgi:hypothetical protein
MEDVMKGLLNNYILVKLLLLIILCLPILVSCSSYQEKLNGTLEAQANWNNYGRINREGLNTFQARGTASVEIGSDNVPVVAYVQRLDSVTYNVHVKRLFGQVWTQVGPSVTNAGPNSRNSPSNPSLRITTDNRPVVAYTLSFLSGGSLISVKRWDGSQWVNMNFPDYQGAANNDFTSPNSLVLDGQNRPVVAFVNSFTTTQCGNRGSAAVVVLRWNGSSWVQLGTERFTLDDCSIGQGRNPSIAQDGSGNIYISWSGANGQIIVERWNGSVWVRVGSINGSGGATQVQVDSTGAPVVVWSSTGGLTTQRWNGTSWANYHNTILGAGTFSFKLNASNRPVIAFSSLNNSTPPNSDLKVARMDVYPSFDPGLLGNPTRNYLLDNTPSANALSPSLSLHSNGRPFVVWTEGTDIFGADYQ